MCLPSTCCCGCTLRQGTVGIIVCDGIWLGWQVLWAVIISLVIDAVSGVTQDELDLFKLIVWILAITPAIRFISGIVSACSNFKQKLRLVHFICRVIADVVDVFIYIISMATYFYFGTIVSLLAFLFFAVYFNWILYAFYKQEDGGKMQAT